MELKQTIELCIMQYGIMYHGSCSHTQSKKAALTEMKLEGLIKESPKNNCFLCEYVKQTFTAPGYDTIIHYHNAQRITKYYAFCTLGCPMTGILWDYRGCMKNPDSPYQMMEESYTHKDRKNHIETMLCAFQELLGKIQHEEEKD